MASEPEPIDIDAFPALRDIVEDVNQSHRPRVIRVGDEDVAMVVPLRPRRNRRRPTAEDHAAFLASAGGWKDLVDTEQLKADIRASRNVPSRRRVEL